MRSNTSSVATAASVSAASATAASATNLCATVFDDPATCAAPMADLHAPSLAWCNSLGEHHDFTAAELDRWAAKTAGLLAARGVGAGDVVAASLRNHYQLWFVAAAARRLGADLLVLPDGADEAEVARMLTESQAKAVVCTNQGHVLEVCEHVVYLCPSVTTRLMVNGDGAQAFFADASDPMAADDLPVYPADGMPHGAALSGPDGVCALGCARPGWLDFNTCVRVARPLAAAFSATPANATAAPATAKGEAVDASSSASELAA